MVELALRAEGMGLAVETGPAVILERIGLIVVLEKAELAVAPELAGLIVVLEKVGLAVAPELAGLIVVLEKAELAGLVECFVGLG